MSQNYINHIALVLDASSSMEGHASQLIKVADDQIGYLAQRSKDLDQETRITVYTFADTVKCVIYDKDVLRLPSIKEHYRPEGMTALIDAAIKSQQDLMFTPTMYGDHSFLTFILTDGQENRSRHRPQALTEVLHQQPDNWTVAVLVPDQRGKFEAKKFGFPADNIAIWDATSAHGVAEAGKTIRAATDTFMVNRSSGIRGTRTMFSTGAEALNVQTVKAAGVQMLTPGTYSVHLVNEVASIRDFVDAGLGVRFQLGKAFYQLSKLETIQPQKMIAVRNKKTGHVYSGDAARQIIGLPNIEVRVRPEFNPEFEVFVQSTSTNRKLMPGTKLLLLK